MGFFSKDKKTTERAVPPMPPAPLAEPSIPMAPSMPNNATPVQGGLSAPPVGTNASSTPEMPQVPEGSNLTPPSLPGGSLDEIKKQVVGPESSDSNFQNSPTPSEYINKVEKVEDTSNSFSNPEIASDDDLFNMFKVDDNEINNTPSENNSKLTPKQEIEDEEPEPIDTTLEHSTELNFESKSKNKSETQFLTTTQFKALLEVVDSVKDRIKASTETHLKLMDMKAEEDVEYESLRKNFQFVEDKLYDLDSILFEQ